MEPASDLLSRVASYGKTRPIDSKFLDLAERVLEDGAAEALKDALAREFQQIADDFRAELQARQMTNAEAA